MHTNFIETVPGHHEQDERTNSLPKINYGYFFKGKCNELGSASAILIEQLAVQN
jgi:hypothetical protein